MKEQRTYLDSKLVNALGDFNSKQITVLDKESLLK